MTRIFGRLQVDFNKYQVTRPCPARVGGLYYSRFSCKGLGYVGATIREIALLRTWCERNGWTIPG